MGMASSDNDAEIMRRHARQDHLRSVPRHPGSWDKPASEEEMAFYRHDLEKWAQNISAAPNPYENERR